MELLRAPIEADLQQFNRRRAPYDAVDSPNFERYDMALQQPAVTVKQIEQVIAWLDDDTGVPGLAPFGYVMYIRLYLQKKLAEKRFHQYRNSNLCMCCFDDMGADNPRQLCCKTHCPYQ